MTYKEKVNQILQALAAIKAGTTNDLTVTYWRGRYEQDVTFLLKQLAERNSKIKGERAVIDRIKKDLDLLKDVIVGTIKELGS